MKSTQCSAGYIVDTPQTADNSSKDDDDVSSPFTAGAA